MPCALKVLKGVANLEKGYISNLYSHTPLPLSVPRSVSFPYANQDSLDSSPTLPASLQAIRCQRSKVSPVQFMTGKPIAPCLAPRHLSWWERWGGGEWLAHITVSLVAGTAVQQAWPISTSRGHKGIASLNPYFAFSRHLEEEEGNRGCVLNPKPFIPMPSKGKII